MSWEDETCDSWDHPCWNRAHECKEERYAINYENHHYKVDRVRLVCVNCKQSFTYEAKDYDSYLPLKHDRYDYWARLFRTNHLKRMGALRAKHERKI